VAVCYAPRPMRKRPRESTAQAADPNPYVRAASVLICVGIIAVSTVMSIGSIDAFRLPKEVVFRTEAIILLVTAVFVATQRTAAWREIVRGIGRAEFVVCSAILGWTLLTTALSTNRLLSMQSTLTVCATIVIYIAMRGVVPKMSWLAVDVCFAIAALNALLITFQENSIWNPFKFPPAYQGHMQSTALIGNPDDVGMYLVAPALAAIIAAFTVGGVRRWWYFAVAATLFGGITASLSRGALLATLAGAVVFAMSRTWKLTVIVVAAVAAIVTLAALGSGTLRTRFVTLERAARDQRYDILFSERLVPFLTAIDMVRKHPLTGVGPGCFKYHYMDERLAVSGEYPATWTRSFPVNFAETHNDHLQVAAETGFPGYLLFLAAWFILAQRGVRRGPAQPAEADTRQFARRLRLPLAIAFFVVALVEFPLQIAAPRLMFITFAAVAIGWDTPACVVAE